MSSKIDVKIRFTSDIKMNDGSSSDTSGGAGNSASGTPRDDSTEKSDNENEKADVQTDDETGADNEHGENQMVDVGSQIETDDDVFANEGDDRNGLSIDGQLRAVTPQSPRRSTSENQEEVDDIDLILSSDDKELTHEELISISYYEPWQKCGKSGTPILTNFQSISSDQGGNDDAAERRDGGNSANTSIEKDAEHELRADEQDDQFEQVNYTVPTRWTNYNVLMETDISKCGIVDDKTAGGSSIAEMRRRNTCPNPPAYRPIIHREALRNHNLTTNRCPLAVKLRSRQTGGPRTTRPIIVDPNRDGEKRNSAAQTDISALPEHWRSESHLNGGMGSVFFTLPSKYVLPTGMNYYRVPLKLRKTTREARRVLLSDINFTSMVPELSRSADHLCQEEKQQNAEKNNNVGNKSNISNVNISGGSGDAIKNQLFYEGSYLKTPDYLTRGITPSVSMTSPGVSQWTVNENSFDGQMTQTDWNITHGDSLDSCRDYSMGSKYSTQFGKHFRSRSLARCRRCRCRHHDGLKLSESMHHTPQVTFAEPNRNKTRSSLPDLRSVCTCGCGRNHDARNSTSFGLGDSYGSTESLIDEAENFLCKSIDGVFVRDEKTTPKTMLAVNRRCSENDIKRDYSPSKQTLPFLPKSPQCLKPGHLAKVIGKNGRCVIGRIRYIGPLASTGTGPNGNYQKDAETFIGLQLPNKIGDCDGSFENRRFFDCEPNCGIFVPFSKIVMAWTS